MEALVTCLTDGAGVATILVIQAIATRVVAVTRIIAVGNTLACNI